MDIAIRNTPDGGDMTLRGNDLEMFSGYENMPYLSVLCGEEWWGDDIFKEDGEDVKFTCETEQLLKTTPLNSNGRLIIEQAIIRDLKHLTKHIPGTEISVTVVITDDNRLDIFINVNGKEYYINWNPDYTEPDAVPEPEPPTPVLPLYHWPAELIEYSGGVLTRWKELYSGTTYMFDHFDTSVLGSIPAPPLNVETNSLNGYTVLKFDGANGENVYTRNPVFDANPHKATLVMVLNIGTGFFLGRMAGLASPGFAFENFPDTFGVLITPTSVRGDMRFFDTTATFKTTVAPTTGGWKVYEFSFDRSGIVKIYIDTVFSYTFDLGSGTLPLGFAEFAVRYLFLGSGYANPGYLPIRARVAEVMLYDKLLTADERSEVVTQLHTKFGL